MERDFVAEVRDAISTKVEQLGGELRSRQVEATIIIFGTAIDELCNLVNELRVKVATLEANVDVIANDLENL